MNQNPVDLFKTWYEEALRASPLKHPKAVCVSTVRPDGTPESRFVALKDVSEAGFVFCSSLTSNKATAIATNAKVSLTFWWDHIERQVRVSGKASLISDTQANKYFQERRRDAQLTSLVSAQSSELDTPETLQTKLRESEAKFEGKPVPRPKTWGGYCVKPEQLEFLTFKANRLHERTLFTLESKSWEKRLLQP